MIFMDKYCKFCGKELKKDIDSFDLGLAETSYEPCDCEIATQIREHKETIQDLEHQKKDIENDIWKHENKIVYLENKYTKYI